MTQSQSAYNFIKNKLLHGQLAPRQRLSNRKLAKELGTSFIPIREAVSRLSSEGFVEYHPGEGAFVRDVSTEDLMEVYDLRLALECHAVEVAAQKINEEQLARMQACNEQLHDIAQRMQQSDPTWDDTLGEAWMLSDAQFHLVISHAAGNSRAIRLLNDLRIMERIFGRRLDEPPRQMMQVWEEHQQLLQALRQKQLDQVRQLLASHIRSGCQRAIQSYKQRHLDQNMQKKVHEL